AVVTSALVAVAAARQHPLGPARAIPVVGRGDGPGMGAEADQRAFVTPALAHQLSDVVLAPYPSYLGRAGVADVAVVRPDQRLRVGTALLQQVIERIGHMLVAQVPALGAAVVHHPVVA